MTDDHSVLDDTAADILVTAIRDAAGSSSGTELDRALDEIGWVDALEVAPRLAVSALFEQQGAACTTSGALGRLLAHALEVPTGPGSAVVLPSFGTATVTATATGDGSVMVRGLGSSDLAASDRAVVVELSDDGLRWCEIPTAELDVHRVDGLDPPLGLVDVSGTVPLDGGWRTTDGAWDSAVASCRLALGHEMVGAMRTMLTLARLHALERVQFDRPIAGFQAVRHRLAESLVAIEAADAALGGAWDDGSPLAAALAKAVCGDSARTVRRHCQQVLAGIGFTNEHDLHRYVRRTIVLDGLLGDSRSLVAEIGAAVLDDREIPGLLPL